MDSIDYKIVVPSYKRVETFGKKTLKYLQECNIPMNKIWLFVADENEYKKYSIYKELGINIVIGVYKLMHQRNFISDYFENGEYLIQIDDDIDYIAKKVGEKQLEPFYELESLIKDAYSAMIENKTQFWGISAVLNHFFMKDGFSTNLKFCVGCFWGCINDKELKLSIDEKEDYERTILFYDKYKKVIRYNGFAPKTSFYKEGGGMQEYRDVSHSHISANILIERYPKYVSMNTKRKGDRAEVKLYHNPKKDTPENQQSLF